MPAARLLPFDSRCLNHHDFMLADTLRFTDENASGPGVRWRKAAKGKSRK
jgi:hypothetical protein